MIRWHEMDSSNPRVSWSNMALLFASYMEPVSLTKNSHGELTWVFTNLSSPHFQHSECRTSESASLRQAPNLSQTSCRNMAVIRSSSNNARYFPFKWRRMIRSMPPAVQPQFGMSRSAMVSTYVILLVISFDWATSVAVQSLVFNRRDKEHWRKLTSRPLSFDSMSAERHALMAASTSMIVTSCSRYWYRHLI